MCNDTLSHYAPVYDSPDKFVLGESTSNNYISQNPGYAVISFQAPTIENIDPTVPKASYATNGSAGLDLYTREEVTLTPSKSLNQIITKIPLNIKINIGQNPSFYAILLPRSSTCMKYGIMLETNTVDNSDNEITAYAINITDHTVTIPKGSNIVKLIFTPVCYIKFTER